MEKLEENIQRTQCCPEQRCLPAVSQVAPRAMVPPLTSHPPGTLWRAWGSRGHAARFFSGLTGLGHMHPGGLSSSCSSLPKAGLSRTKRTT